MNASQVVKEVMTEQGITNTQLAKRVGCSNSAIFERLKQGNISSKLLVEMLSAIDYELVVKPISKGPRPADEKVVGLK